MPEPGRTAFSALRSSSHPIGDLVLAAAARLAASIILFLFGGLIVSLLAGSWPVIPAFGAEFLWCHRWGPPSDAFGALAPIYGTLITALIALWIAAPISFGIAFFLTELSPAWLRRPLGAAIELLAAIPSIVYGMWGLMVFAPVFAEYIQQPLGQFLGPLPLIGLLFQGPPIGIGLLCAGIILAIMIIPYIASVMCEANRCQLAVPETGDRSMGAAPEIGQVAVEYTRQRRGQIPSNPTSRRQSMEWPPAVQWQRPADGAAMQARVQSRKMRCQN